MTNDDTTNTDRKPDATPACEAWITPAVHKIKAGEAEVGTRNRNDGPFTTS